MKHNKAIILLTALTLFACGGAPAGPSSDSASAERKDSLLRSEATIGSQSIVIEVKDVANIKRIALANDAGRVFSYLKGNMYELRYNSNEMRVNTRVEVRVERKSGELQLQTLEITREDMTPPEIVASSPSVVIRGIDNVTVKVIDASEIKRVYASETNKIAGGQDLVNTRGNLYQLELDYRGEPSGSDSLSIYAEDILGNRDAFVMGLNIINDAPGVELGSVASIYVPIYLAEFSISRHPGQEIDYDSIKCLEGGESFSTGEP